MDKWKAYLLIAIIPMIGGTASKLMRIIIAFSLRDTGISVFDITVLSSSFMLSRAFLSPIMGRWADRGMKRYKLILIGFAGLLVDSQLYLYLPYFGVLGLRVLDGIFSAMVWPTMQAIVHFSSPNKLKARIMSMYFIMGSVGMSLGYIIYAYTIGEELYAVFLVAVIYAIELIMSLALKNTEPQNKEITKKTHHGKINLQLFTMTFIFGMYISLGNEVILFYLAEVMHLGKADATLILFVGVLISLLGSILFGHLADKKGFKDALLLLGVLASISAIFISLNAASFAILGVFLMFIAGRGFTPISRSFTASTGKNIGTSLGLVNLSSNLGSMLGPLIGGAIMDHFGNHKYMMFNLSALSFLALGALAFISALAFNASQARLVAS